MSISKQDLPWGAEHRHSVATRIERHWYFVAGEFEPVDEKRRQQVITVLQHAGALVFMAFYYLLVLFVTASFTLTGSGYQKVRWDRGFKATVCVAKTLGYEGCGWDIVMEEYRASRNGSQSTDE
jgi:hypothetical protein